MGIWLHWFIASWEFQQFHRSLHVVGSGDIWFKRHIFTNGEHLNLTLVDRKNIHNLISEKNVNSLDQSNQFRKKIF